MFVVSTGGEELRAPFLILATGVVDNEPDMPNVREAMRSGLVRQCPICDGYEAMGRRLAVITDGERGLGEALFLRSYTPHITAVTSGRKPELSAEAARCVADAGIRIEDKPIHSIRAANGSGVHIEFVDGTSLDVDFLYSALGVTPSAGLAAMLGVERSPESRILVKEHQRTSVDGCYAAGDVVTGLNQLGVAMAQGEIAAVDIHNRLRQREGLALPA